MLPALMEKHGLMGFVLVRVGLVRLVGLVVVLVERTSLLMLVGTAITVS